MANVVDDLLVNLNINAEGFRQGANEVNNSLNELRDNAGRTSGDLERHGDRAASFYSKIRREAALMLAVFTAGKGMAGFAKDTMEANNNLERAAWTIGLTTDKLRALQDASKIVGGSGGIIDLYKYSSNVATTMKVNGRAPEELTSGLFANLGGHITPGMDADAVRNEIVRVLTTVATGANAYIKTSGMEKGQVAEKLMSGLGLSEANKDLYKMNFDPEGAATRAQALRTKRTQEEKKSLDEMQGSLAKVEISINNLSENAMLKLMGYVKEIGSTESWQALENSLTHVAESSGMKKLLEQFSELIRLGGHLIPDNFGENLEKEITRGGQAISGLLTLLSRANDKIAELTGDVAGNSYVDKTWESMKNAASVMWDNHPVVGTIRDTENYLIGVDKEGKGKTASGEYVIGDINQSADTSPRVGGSRAWRNKNAGNLRYGSLAKQFGAIGQDSKGFAIFGSDQQGDAARSHLIFDSNQGRQLSTHADYGAGLGYKDKTLMQMVAAYAPPEDHNDTAKYQRDVLSAVGGRNKHMHDYSPSERLAILKKMKEIEGYKAPKGWGSIGGDGKIINNNGAVTININGAKSPAETGREVANVLSHGGETRTLNSISAVAQ